jgi:hypothetical protein
MSTAVPTLASDGGAPSYYLIPPFSAYHDFMLYFSIVTSLGGFWQAFRILRNVEDVDHVNMLPWGVSLVSNAGWIIYGMMEADNALLFSSGLSCVGSLVVLVLLMYYSPSSVLHHCMDPPGQSSVRSGNTPESALVECLMCGSTVRRKRINERGVHVYVLPQPVLKTM